MFFFAATQPALQSILINSLISASHQRSDAGLAVPLLMVTASRGEKRGLFLSPPPQGEEARGEAAFLRPPAGHRGCLEAVAGGPGAWRRGKEPGAAGRRPWRRAGAVPLLAAPAAGPGVPVSAHAQAYSASAPSSSFEQKCPLPLRLLAVGLRASAVALHVYFSRAPAFSTFFWQPGFPGACLTPQLECGPGASSPAPPLCSFIP